MSDGVGDGVAGRSDTTVQQTIVDTLDEHDLASVSYTHLTLPTILRV